MHYRFCHFSTICRSGRKSATIAALLVPPIVGCEARVETTVLSAPKAQSEGFITRTFDIQSASGMFAERDQSGLGFDLSMPRDVSTEPAFFLTATAGVSDVDLPPFLLLESDMARFERPAAVTVPIDDLGQDIVKGQFSIAVEDSSGFKRTLPESALTWTDEDLTVATIQPLGRWHFQNQAADAVTLTVKVSGLSSDESVRYSIELSGQDLTISNLDISFPDETIYQRVTGEETRAVALRDKTSARYRVIVQEAPVYKNCTIAGPTERLLTASDDVEITCVDK